MHRWYWIIFSLGALALIIGPVQFGDGRTKPLAAEVSDTLPLAAGPFRWDGNEPSTDGHNVPPRIATRGSWIGGGEFRGAHETGWYAVRERFTVLVAGHPAHGGNRLEIEFRRADGTVRVVRYEGADPGSTWQPWNVASPADATAVRLRAIDASGGANGWLGFSEPFSLKSLPEWQLWALLQLAATTCLALTLLYGPGLLWMRRGPRAAHELALAIIIGPLLLATLGVACWALGGWIAPATVARVGIIALLAALAWGGRATRKSVPVAAEARAIVAAGALLAGFAVAKANFSAGPEGELYGDLVSRSLEVGGHSDSRVPFHVVQVVANHFAPFAPEAEAYFSPWSFASRGPLAGLLASPLVLATGAHVPRDMPDQPWRPFDREGFAAYRITLIVLASLAGWAVFGAATVVASPACGVLAAVIALLAPFFVHELFFTWPKLLAGGMVLAAFVLAHTRRALAAGAMLGLGYLFHPLALLSVPFLGVWVFARGATNGARWKRLTAPLWFGAGVAFFVVPWLGVARLRAQAGGSQAVFLTFFRMADNQWATWATWWHSRWDNLANTFLPFYLLAGDPTHESINSVYAPSDHWVHAGFLYWNTLPFALGLPAFLLLVVVIAAAARRSPGVAFVTVAGPALLLVAYWGAASTGLMRHCGHVLFLSVVVLGAWSLQLRSSAWRRAAFATFLHPACFAWRGAEIALMSFGTTLLNRFPRWGGPFDWNDIGSLAVAAACLASAVILLAKVSVSLNPASSSP